MFETLNQLYPNRVNIPQNVNDIVNNIYYVYVLTYNDSPIVVGHGKKNRAKVIFDDSDTITQSHLKALLVRLYRIFGDRNFSQFVISCTSKEEAKIIEKNLHINIGGNRNEIDQNLLTILFDGINIDSRQYIYLKLALLSSFDGLSDLKKWRRNGVISDADWEVISNRLQIDY
jgi:hypothetical protein